VLIPARGSASIFVTTTESAWRALIRPVNPPRRWGSVSSGTNESDTRLCHPSKSFAVSSSNIVILRSSLGFDRLVDARCPVTLSPGGGAVTVGDRITDRSVAAVLPASSHTCPRGRGSRQPVPRIDDPCAGGGLGLATRADLPQVSSTAMPASLA